MTEVSEATQDFQQESIQAIDEIEDYEVLKDETNRQRVSLFSPKGQQRQDEDRERSDEFVRNFFIKFGMKKTLDKFQTEWHELRA